LGKGVSVNMRPTRFRRLRLGLAVAAAIGLAACQTMGHGGLTTRQVAALQAEGFERTERGWEFGVNDRLLFPIDQSGLTADERAAVRRIAESLVAVGIGAATIEGHADDTGSSEHNLTLSRDRAEAVAKEMTGSGFPAAGLTVVGLGEKYPIDTNRTSRGRRENRRVVVLVGAQ
jgi:outer membrane protein OmpA-like peptidoglycan-associated protein